MDDVVVDIEEESTHDDDEALTSIQNTITMKHLIQIVICMRSHEKIRTRYHMIQDDTQSGTTND